MDLERILNPASGFTQLEDLNIKQLHKLVEMYNLQTKIKGYKTKTKDQLILELRQRVPNIDAKMGMLEGLTIKQVIKLVQEHNADSVIKNYKKMSKAEIIQALRQRLPHLEFAPEVPVSITPEAAEAEVVEGDPFEFGEEIERKDTKTFKKGEHFRPLGIPEGEGIDLTGTNGLYVDTYLDVLREDPDDEEGAFEVLGNLEGDEYWKQLPVETQRDLMFNSDGSYNHLYNLLLNEEHQEPRALADGADAQYIIPNYAMFPSMEKGTYILNLENGDIIKDGVPIDNMSNTYQGKVPLRFVNSLRRQYSAPQLYANYQDPDTEVVGDPFEEPIATEGAGEVPEEEKATPTPIFVNLGNFTYNRKKRTIKENTDYAAPARPTEYRLFGEAEYTKKELSRLPPVFDTTDPKEVARLPEGRRALSAEDISQLTTIRDDIFFSLEELDIAKRLGVYRPLLSDRIEVAGFLGLGSEYDTDTDMPRGDYRNMATLVKDQQPRQRDIFRREDAYGISDDVYNSQRKNRRGYERKREKSGSMNTILYNREGQRKGQIFYHPYGHRIVRLGER